MGALLILIAPAFAQQEDPLGNPILYSFVVDTPTIYAAGVSPDGQYLVVLGDSSTAINLKSSERRALDVPSGLGRSLIWTTDGAYLGVWLPLAEDWDAVENIEAVLNTATWELAEVVVSDLDWNMSTIPDAELHPSQCGMTSIDSLEIGGGEVLSLPATAGQPVSITGSGNRDLATDFNRLRWYDDLDFALFWSATQTEVWDVAAGRRLVSGHHIAPDFFTCAGDPFPPHIGNGYLVTFAYGVARPDAEVTVYVEDDGLSLRTEPTINGALIERMPSGTRVTITGDYVDADGYRWWPIETPSGASGWSVESADDIQTLITYDPRGGTAQVWVYAILDVPPLRCELTLPSTINVRSGSSTSTDITNTLSVGMTVVATAQTIGDDGFVWWQIADGWVREDVIGATEDCKLLPRAEK